MVKIVNTCKILRRILGTHKAFNKISLCYILCMIFTKTLNIFVKKERLITCNYAPFKNLFLYN